MIRDPGLALLRPKQILSRHGEMDRQMVDLLCEQGPGCEQESTQATVAAPQARIRLWDGIAKAVEKSENRSRFGRHEPRRTPPNPAEPRRTPPNPAEPRRTPPNPAEPRRAPTPRAPLRAQVRRTGRVEEGAAAQSLHRSVVTTAAIADFSLFLPDQNENQTDTKTSP
jgi:hypothetical protein